MIISENLHRLPAEQILDKYVTKRSQWSDRRWTFTETTSGRYDKSIDWGRRLADGTSLLEDDWAPFLDASKRFVSSMIYEPVVFKSLKASTLAQMADGFFFLVDWMSLAGYRHYYELDAEAIDEYLEHLELEKVERRGLEKAVGEVILRYITPLAMIWRQTDAVSPSGAETLPGDPLRARSTVAVAKEIAAFKRAERPPVDDDTFIATTNGLQNWLTFIGDDVVRLLDLSLDLKESFSELHWYKSTKGGSATGPQLRDFRFSDDPSTGRPWHVSLTQDAKGVPHAIRTLVESVVTACVICVQATAGIRISEISGFPDNPNHTGLLPSCIEVVSSSDGLFDLFFMCGRVYKGKLGWVEAKWVVGLRPKGTDILPPAVQAAVLVRRLFQRWREMGGVPFLFFHMRSRIGLPNTSNSLVRRYCVNTFQHEWVVAQIRNVPSVRLTSHQWRKAWVRFLFRVDNRLLPAMSLHLQHLSLAVTEYYVGTDSALIEDIHAEASRYATERLLEAVGGKAPLRGPLANMIERRCKELEARFSNLSADQKGEEVRRIVEDNDIRLWPLRHGLKPYGTCIFRPSNSQCGIKRNGLFLRPDFAAANPGLCSDCGNIAMEIHHLGFWLERLAENELLLSPVEGIDVGVAMQAQRRVDQCKKVISWIQSGSAQAA